MHYVRRMRRVAGTIDLLTRDERPWPSSGALAARGQAFLAACDPHGVRAVVEDPAPWRSPEALWAALDGCTPLGRLAEYGRDPARNRLPDGRVQSQGEHTVALVEGLHALRRGDLAWFSARASGPLGASGTALLAAVARWARDAEEAVFRATLLAGAFHDCGKLVGDVPGVDAENGVVLYDRLMADAGVGGPYATLGSVLVRFHDLVRHHAAPGMLAFLTNAAAEASAGPGCAHALAAVQAAGRASIGVRRLGADTLEAMADLVGRWPSPPPPPVRLTIVHTGCGTATLAHPFHTLVVDHVVTVDEPAGPVTLLNGTACGFAA